MIITWMLMQAVAAAPACKPDDANLPRELKAWATPRRPVAAGAAAERAPTVGLDAPVALTMVPQASVRFAATPEDARPSARPYAGMVRVTVRRPGTYRVSASNGPWMDVVRDGRVLRSTGHGHFAPCTTLRKTVEYTLTPGAYVVQLSAGKEARTDLMISRKP